MDKKDLQTENNNLKNELVQYKNINSLVNEALCFLIVGRHNFHKALLREKRFKNDQETLGHVNTIENFVDNTRLQLKEAYDITD